jgi:metal-sulfur cluster biosynthetic enzyme
MAEINLSDETIINALKTVHDPEMGVNIVDLGLVYRLDVEDNGDILVYMTLTSPGCPAGPEIRTGVRESLETLEGVNQVKVQVVWNPPWSPSMISEAGLEELGVEVDENGRLIY